jgi:hypothetical protein
VPRRRQARAIERGPPPARVKKTDRQSGLKANAIECADGLEELDGLPVAAHKQVLAVVDHRAGGGIAKRPSAPPEMGLLLEQAHAAALFRHCDCGRKARKTAADD